MLPGSIQTQGKGLVLLPVEENKSSSSAASRTKLQKHSGRGKQEINTSHNNMSWTFPVLTIQDYFR